MRARNRPASRQRRKRILKQAKGFYGARSRRFRNAKEAVYHALSYQFVSRKQRKRDFRRLWIVRINAAARLHGMKYGELIHGLKKADVQLNRKVLADIAVSDADSFKAIVDIAKAA